VLELVCSLQSQSTKAAIPFADLTQCPVDGFLHKISLIIRTGLDQWENCMNASTGACLSCTANSAIITKPARHTNSFSCHLSQRGNRDSQRLGRPDAKPDYTFDGLGICMQFSFRDDLL